VTFKETIKVGHPHPRHPKPTGRRGIGEGDPVIIRISNPTSAAVEYRVFVN
jgi:hypothetical protein